MNPVEASALDMLEKHCARCHQDGRLGSKLKPAGRFGNVLQLRDLASNSHFVKPGNPDASLLFNVIAEQKMPYDVFQDFVEPAPTAPTASEVQALRAWIESLGQAAVASCETRKFVTNNDVVSAVAADLQIQKEHRIRGTRYLTLTHLYNACTTDKLLDGYRQAVVKLLNSLSSRSDVVTLETVDPERTIIRFNLDDLGWDESSWDALVAAYPYGAKSANRLFAFAQGATRTELPYLRGDWFTFAAAQPPLYNVLLRLPDTLRGLERKLGVDVGQDIAKGTAQRAGFQHSGVSANNRLIERHTTGTGVFWTSYDFGGNRERQSLFKFPVGPGGPSGFEHDGGETIFSLPNGFQGYYLSTAQGRQLATGPTQIVRDPSRRDLAVTNGISCLGCHDQGIRKARDEVRRHVVADRSFPKEVRDSVEALYPTTEAMDALLDQDMKRFRDAMVRAGIDPGVKPNGIEMINALSQKYEEMLDLRQLAVEFGMRPDEFARAAPAAGQKAVALLRRVEQGLLPRDTFESEYASLVAAVTDEEPLRSKAAASGARVESGLAGQFDLSLTSDKTSYRQNETAVITVVAKRSCHLTLIDVDGSGVGTIIFPNRFQQDNRIDANVPFTFGNGPAFKFRLMDKGSETVIAECNASKPASRGFEADYRANGFTDLGNYAQRLTRQIVVGGETRSIAARRIQVEAGRDGTGPAGAATRPATGLPAAVTSTVPAQADTVSRTAIKLEVR